MPTKLKKQTDYLLTEGSVEIPANLSEIDAIMKATKATGKLVVVYNNGGVLGINIEQKCKATDIESAKIRAVLGVSTKAL